jgi:hypothetical protein
MTTLSNGRINRVARAAGRVAPGAQAQLFGLPFVFNHRLKAAASLTLNLLADHDSIINARESAGAGIVAARARLLMGKRSLRL